MNRMKFGEMSKKKRDLYECMWGSNNFDFPVEKTKIKDGVSNNSYTFTSVSAVNQDICGNRLAELFQIQNKALFLEKFSQSCNGSGQEAKKIATIHSSSLCALLFFYNVTKDNPYIMNIGGEEYEFTDSRSEYQNTVIEGRNPSNMDVVLVGKHMKSSIPIVFFLESKFSEYYERIGKQLKIAREYLNNNYSESLYRGNFIEKMGFHIVEEDGNSDFCLICDNACYVEGIKQMISHYIGVKNLCDNPDVKNDDVAKAISSGAKVLLGEILFTKGIGMLPVTNGEKCFSSYQKKYAILAEALNEQLRNDGIQDKINVLPELLSYSQFQDKDFVRETKVKRFYFELGK